MTIRNVARIGSGLWLLGAIGIAQAQAPADPYNYARTSTYTYFGPVDGTKNGLVASETIEPDVPSLCVVTSYDYDAQGNRTSVTTSNCASASGRALFASRTANASYTGSASQAISVQGSNINVVVPNGAFETGTSNALAQSESSTYDPRFGEALRQTDVNGLITDRQLDDFGREIVTKLPDGTRKLTWYCVIGAGLDTTSNSVIGGVSCPTLASGEAPTDAATFTHVERRDSSGTMGVKMAPFQRVYRDRLGREIRSVTESFDGASQPVARKGVLVVQDTLYNPYGGKELETQPYFLASGSSTLSSSNDRGITKTEYDALGRAIRTQTVDSAGSSAAISFGPFGTSRAATLTSSYSQLAVTTTNDQGYTRKEEMNALGEVVRITDATGGQLVRQFDAFGNLAGTKDALQNTTSFVFDLRGRKMQMLDPDAGQIDYCYDALGQLKAQQNATMRGALPSGQCPTSADSGTTATTVVGWSTYAYDKLGRTTHRVDPEYDSRWYFDTYFGGGACNKGIGQLCESRTSNGVTRKLVYDSMGRLINQRTDVTSGPSFASAMAFDTVTGRLDSKTYPTGLKVLYRYTALGHFDKLLLSPSVTLTPLPATAGGNPGATVNLPASSVLWQAVTVGAQGKPEQQLYGNGVSNRSVYDAASARTIALSTGIGSSTSVIDNTYSWDSIGNLTGRRDANGDGATGAVNETFAYADGLNRLTDYTVAASNIPNLNRIVALEYNVAGMLLYKSDVGIYQYGTQGSGAARPHAVQSLTGIVNATFSYDANGNLKTSSSSKYRTLSYTSFNLPDSNTGAQGASGIPTYTWAYDESHARIKETRVDASGVRTTWYLHPDNAGGLAFESETAPDGKLSQRHYLSVGSLQIGVLVSTAALPTLLPTQTAPSVLSSIALAKVEYWHPDHLGSLAATTDHLGGVTARYAYDPFGKRRFGDGNYDAAGNLVIDWSPNINRGTDRGFTEHEHLDDLGLVHMNGRIYDPLIGRFLSADPNVTRPDVLQNYDRYSYVLNNPLNFTDPTGFDVSNRNSNSCSLGSGCEVVYLSSNSSLNIPGQINQTACDSTSQLLSGSRASNAQSLTIDRESVLDGSVVSGAVDRFRNRLINAFTRSEFKTDQEIEEWGKGLQVAMASRDPHALTQYLRENPLGGGLKGILEIVLSGGLAGAESVLGKAAGAQLATRGTQSVATEGLGALGSASGAAFRAAERIREFSVPLKHLPGAGGRWAKFAEGTNPNALIEEALRSSSAKFLPNSVEGSYKVITDLGRVVGANGETSIRVIIGQDGKIWTAFPVK